MNQTFIRPPPLLWNDHSFGVLLLCLDTRSAFSSFLLFKIVSLDRKEDSGRFGRSTLVKGLYIHSDKRNKIKGLKIWIKLKIEKHRIIEYVRVFVLLPSF